MAELASTKPKTANLSIKLDASDRERLQSIAMLKKRTPHFLMKEAIQRYLAAEEAEQQLVNEAAASLAHYKATGLHTTLDEMKAWAESVKSDRTMPMPTWHK
jgi:predicted transcriptional regulator